MPGYQAWPTPATMDDWMKQQERRVSHEERRPIIQQASDLMGPGLAPHAVEVSDWNAEETLFNGIFTSNPNSGTQHSPDASQHWVGVSYATADGTGYQQVWNDDDPPISYLRSFTTVGDSTEFGNWVLSTAGGGGGGLTAEQVRDIIGTTLVEGSGIDIVVNDAADTVTITATGGAGGVDEVWVGPGIPPDPGAELWYDTDEPTTGGGGVDEVWVGPDTPTDPNIELWYDTDEPSTGGGGAGVDQFSELTDVTWPTTLKDGAVYVWNAATSHLVQHMVLGPESSYVDAFEAALT